MDGNPAVAVATAALAGPLTHSRRRSTSSRSGRTPTTVTSERGGRRPMGRGRSPCAVRGGDQWRRGHQSEGGGMLAARRRAEAREAGQRVGIDYVVLDNHDGELVPSLKSGTADPPDPRWKADFVLSPRPNDYHPDHRYTGVLVQDAAFMVTVPNVASDTPPLRRIRSSSTTRIASRSRSPSRRTSRWPSTTPSRRRSPCSTRTCRSSTSGCPWHDGTLDQVPKDADGAQGLAVESAGESAARQPCAPHWRSFTGRTARQNQNAEAFEICEYGRRPNAEEISGSFRFSLAKASHGRSRRRATFFSASERLRPRGPRNAGRLAGRLGQGRQVAHLAPGPRLRLAVQVQLDVGKRARRRPVRLAVAPQVAEQVRHRRRPQERRRPERQPAHRPQLLLELARDRTRRTVRCPELCGRGASSLTSDPASRVRNISTQQHADHVQRLERWRARSGPPRAPPPERTSAGAIVTSRMWRACVFSMTP